MALCMILLCFTFVADEPRVANDHRSKYDKRKLPVHVLRQFKPDNIQQTNPVNKLQKLALKNTPLFKIPRRRLHSNYLTRIKSLVEVNLGYVTKRLLCRPSFKKLNPKAKLKKAGSEKSKAFEIDTSTDFDFKMSLPSGLVLSMSSTDAYPLPIIKQKNIDPNSSCCIKDEVLRTTTPDGNVVIKKSNGHLMLYTSSGNMTECSIVSNSCKSGLNPTKMNTTNFTEQMIVPPQNVQSLPVQRESMDNGKVITNPGLECVLKKKLVPFLQFDLLSPNGKYLSQKSIP